MKGAWSVPMVEASRCPVCSGSVLRSCVQTARANALRCSVCGHLTVVHAPHEPIEQDYHEQYVTGARLDALRRTRLRQADAILDLIARHLSPVDHVLDFGAGRGWFLQRCKERNVPHLAGADISRISTDAVAALGIPAVQLPVPTGGRWDLPALPFAPRVATFLDVIEHFAPEFLVALIRSVLMQLGERLDLVVVKVPVASGLLFRTARALSAVGRHGALHHLLQVGTYPPHLNYFTRDSLVRLLHAAGLVPLAALPDRDFEPVALAEQARILAGVPALPASIGSAAGAVLAFSCDRFALQDSLIVIASPQREREEQGGDP